VTEFSFAHLSDLHLPLGGRPPLAQLLGKRGLSWLSWTRSRRFIHRPEILAAVMADIEARGVDHVVISGDLVNLALPEEFAAARDWLKRAGGPDRITVAPGNHDALVPIDWNAGLGLWAEWMSDDRRPNAPDAPAFPFVRERGGLAMIGVSTAVPTAPGLATGEVGPEQLQALKAELLRLGAEGRFRIVVLHHPITEGAVSARKALTDRAALRALLAEVGCELVLHGHSHHASMETVQGPAGPIPVLGAPSASSDPRAKGEPAGWRRVAVASEGEGRWAVEVETRRLTLEGFETPSRYTLKLSAPSSATRSAA
jgi:3',5'-cyclic AMP phosphodiesterase CpdA